MVIKIKLQGGSTVAFRLFDVFQCNQNGLWETWNSSKEKHYTLDCVQKKFKRNWKIPTDGELGLK